ncbi:hypothetical protein V1508DRAFT_394838 [Lipomyces doorenjongii]|uniref:uncharacterized protein n=1 Tax=Lipomyces doorenjongii TaxID=383834 RepID=UPI0034CEBB10
MPPDENMSPEPVVDQAAWFSPPGSAGSGMSSATFEYASPALVVSKWLGFRHPWTYPCSKAIQRTRIEDAPVPMRQRVSTLPPIEDELLEPAVYKRFGSGHSDSIRVPGCPLAHN